MPLTTTSSRGSSRAGRSSTDMTGALDVGGHIIQPVHKERPIERSTSLLKPYSWLRYRSNEITNIFNNISQH